MSDSSSSQIILSGHGLHQSYRVGKKSVRVLNGVDIDIRKGELIFLCGASGAGKTTLMYTLAGLERPKQGRVEIEGTTIYNLSRKKQAALRNSRIGYVFQNYFLLPELTALENVAMPATIAGLDRRNESRDILEKIGLGNRLEHLPSELSGGEQQRVAIARSLINKPAVLFADEPTGNLDSKNGKEVMDTLLNLTSERQTTLIIVTHDLQLATIGQRTLHIKDGKIES